jgi:hypothetical protein
MIEMAETETQPVAVIDSSPETKELLSMVRELKAILKKLIAALKTSEVKE